MNFLKLLFNEIKSWRMACVLSMPGNIGFYCRKRFFSKRLASCGKALWLMPHSEFYGMKNISIGDDFTVGTAGLVSSESGRLSVGNGCALNARVSIVSDFGEIKIGNNVIIGMNTIIRAANHRFTQSPQIPIKNQGHEAGKIVIGNDVWIGANVCILPGAQIGDHCVIAAGAVVTGVIPDQSVAAGVPAKVIKRVGESI